MSEQVALTNLSFVVFKIGTEYYGIYISQVQEIIKMQDITGVPDIKEYIMGVINLRGKIVPVISLRRRLDIGEDNCTKKTRIIIVDTNDFEVGLIVDEISKVVAVLPGSMERAEEELIGKGERFLEYIIKSEDGVIGILNLEILLDSNELA